MTDLTTKDLAHTHHWKEKYTQIDGVSCFGGLVCDCGLILTTDGLTDFINRRPNSIILIQHTMSQHKPGPSETK